MRDAEQEEVMQVHDTSQSEKPLVLVVDDDESIINLVQTSLTRNGYKTIIAYDGQEGSEMAKICSPAAIVLDWMMPNMDGMEMLRYIRSQPETKDIPVIMLTGKKMTQDVLAAIENGASEYLVKPFEMSEFIARFKKTLIQFSPCELGKNT